MPNTPANNSENLDHIRHSLAHLLAAAVLKEFPDAKLGIGPTIDNGFYYDFELPRSLAPEDLKTLEKTMRGFVNKKLPFVGEEVSTAEAKKRFAHQPFKLDLINEFAADGKTLTIYHTGVVDASDGDEKSGVIFSDLCRGGHVENTSEIPADAFKLDKIAGAYWRGDEKNPQLQRIYGLAFASGADLDAYLKMQEEAEKRDHKKLGPQLDLFTFSETVGKGLPLFTPKGSTVRRELERFIVDEELKRGYLHVYTPDIAKLDLYIKSGHYPHYKDSMYAPIEIDKEKFMLRPMTCPHHFEVYLRKPVSYRELPMRIAELAKLYRYEQSGELMGLLRVRTFCLADAHIICADEEQAAEEVTQALDLIEYVTGIFGLVQGTDYSYRLSLGNRTDSEKYYKNDAAWEKGEDLLRKLLIKRGKKFVEAENEAAFYGPKIDIQMRNVNGKEDTAFTVQYDFCMPDRFDLKYTAADGTAKRAFVVHRSSIGCIERIMAFLIERYAGAFPVWLAPVQATILPVGEKFSEYGRRVYDSLMAAGIRAEFSEATESLGKRIREAEMMKIPYVLVVGEKEEAAGTVAVRSRKGDEGTLETEKFIEKIKHEIKEKSL